MTQDKSFGEMNFGNAQLGDKRRTKRLVKLVDQMCQRPGGTLPQKFRSPADLQAFYRLMRCKEVTHEAILASHLEATMAKIAEMDTPVVIIHDATEFDFTTHKSLSELGQIGNGNRRGYIAQNSLAVDPATRRVLGLCNQVLHRRDKVSKSETNAQKRNRGTRESLLWLKGTEPLPNSWQLVDVCDRGADTFEFLEYEFHSGRRFVIRANCNRNVLVGHGDPKTSEKRKLREYARSLPEVGQWSLEVTRNVEVRSPRRKGKKQVIERTARTAMLAVSFAPIQVQPSKKRTGNYSNAPLQVWVVRVWEIDPPEGQEPLEWILLTNEPVKTFTAAYCVVGWYECRWIVEEFHKGTKTGCKIESPQFTDEERLKPAIALISIVTLTLMEMRDASRRPDAKTRKATTIISPAYVEVLSLWRNKTIQRDWTVHDFYYALARLGGHQNRKHDHPPGWQVIWEGWKELLPMVIGYEAAMKTKKCG
jgi:Transposase DNA-binding